MITVSGLSLTVRAKTSGCSRWFSSCWYSTKKTSTAMPGGHRVDEAGEHGDDAADGGADQRDQVGDADEQRDQPGERARPMISRTT